MDIQQLISYRGSFNVLLIGDSCIDEYKIGTVDRLSPEAPVPVVKIVDEYTTPGMASNVYENFKALGIVPDFVTNKEQIKKTRFMDQRSGQHLLRVDYEPEIRPWSGTIPRNLNIYDAIVISDYNKGFLSYEQIEAIVHKANCPVFIDTKKQDLSRLSSDNCYVKINEVEYRQRTSAPGNLIVTLGGQGAMLKQRDHEAVFPAIPAEVVDVCGCGDTFLSALAYQYLQTQDIEQAIIFANKAASITVQRQGNYSPTHEEIKKI